MVIGGNSAAGDPFEHTLVLPVRNLDVFWSSHRSEMASVWWMTGGVYGYSVEYLYLYSIMLVPLKASKEARAG